MSRRLVIAIELIVAGIFLAWPLLAIPFLKRMPIGVAMSLWGLSFFAGVVVLTATMKRTVRLQGRAWTADRPSLGIAGKRWGIVVPTLTIPVAILIVVPTLVIALFRGNRTVLVSIALLICARLVYVYVKMVRLLSVQRMEISRRSDFERGYRWADQVETDTAARCATPALECIAATFGVPAAKLRPTDRFGYELGSLSFLDETIDRIGALLLDRQRSCGRPAALEHIRTVGDYVCEWCRCSS